MKSFALKYLFVLLFLSLATWLIWDKFNYPLTGIDDANIFLVYAKNLSNGHGFVYNISGERVEGFSSLLWTLICAVAFRLSAKPELTLLILNVIIVALGTTVALSYLSRRGDSGRLQVFWSLTFLILLFSSPTYILWNTISLMENAIWGILLLFATIFIIREDILTKSINSTFIPLAVLLLLTRPESFLWVAVFVGILLARRTMADGIIQTLKNMAPTFAVVVITVIGLTAFRLSYFGYPLPNTYYAKMSPSLTYNISQGSIYFLQYFRSSPIVMICVLAVGLTGMNTILMFISGKFRNDGSIFLPVIAGVGLLVPLITGGDHFGSFRFYQGLFPILLLCLIYCCRSVLPQYFRLEFNPNTPRWSQLAFVSSLGLVIISFFILYQIRIWKSFKETSEMSVEFGLAREGRETGRNAQEIFEAMPEFPSVGVVTAGGIKYTYQGEVVDLMGLNNVLMAHNGGDRSGLKNHSAFEKSTFYQLLPDIVYPQVVSNDGWQYKEIPLKKSWANTVALKGLFDDPAFLEQYTYAKIEKTTDSDKALVGWFKKDYLSKLIASGHFDIESYEYRGSE